MRLDNSIERRTSWTCGRSKRRLPGGVFDYIDGAAEDERSLARSMTAFADIEFKPRVLRDVSEIDTTTTLLGEPMAFPFIAAPTGFTRIAHSEGELASLEPPGVPGFPSRSRPSRPDRSKRSQR